jgi:AraC-like DNA-binding protein
MNRPNPGKPRGVLNPHVFDGDVRHARVAPLAELAPFVEHFWIVHWDLRRPFRVETLPHPSVHFTIENRRSAIGGVNTGKFSRLLSGRGRVFGIKFRPGMFRSLLAAPVHTATDRVLPVRKVFGAEGVALVRRVLAEPDTQRCVEHAEAFLAPRLSSPDSTMTWVRDLVERMAVDRTLVRVEQVASLAQMELRRLQRLFRIYVGVSPKWVIQRYRLHEAAEQIVRGDVSDMATLALQLGYFDQAHFIRDFKAMVGCPPGEYRAIRTQTSA